MPMRRFPLRLKIAGFAGGLILLATVLVALFIRKPGVKSDPRSRQTWV